MCHLSSLLFELILTFWILKNGDCSIEFRIFWNVNCCKLLVTDSNKLSLIISLSLNVNVIKFIKKYAATLIGFTITYGFLHPVTARLQRNLIGLESGSGRILIFEIRPNPVPAGFKKSESGAALIYIIY